MGYGLTDGNPDQGWWWLTVVCLLALVAHCAVVLAVMVRGPRPWPFLLLGLAASVVPVVMAWELFAVPAVAVWVPTVALEVVARRTQEPQQQGGERSHGA